MDEIKSASWALLAVFTVMIFIALSGCASKPVGKTGCINGEVYDVELDEYTGEECEE
jgi:hypothetical protein